MFLITTLKKGTNMNYIQGNLIKAIKNHKIDIAIHNCNCFCTMGKGIALGLKNNFPSVYSVDCLTKKGDREKLGTYSTCTLANGVHICNGYGQFTYFDKNDMLYYGAVESYLKKINDDFDKNLTIGMPKIGAGLAGGNWNIIEEIIQNSLKGRIINVYYL